LLCSYLRFGKFLHDRTPLDFREIVIQQHLQPYECYFRHPFPDRRASFGKCGGNIRMDELRDQT
jgi:hypothetical protein